MPRTKYRIRRKPSIGASASDAPPTDPVGPPTTKTCRICRLEKPISEYRRRSKGGELRHCYCNGCRRTYESDRRFALRHGKIAEFNARLAKHRLDSRAVVQLCHQLFAHFRGVDNFARLWKEHLDAAMQQTPGRKYVLDAFGALMSLMRFADEYRERHRPDLSGMTDDELRASLRDLLEAGAPNDEGLEEDREDADA